MAADRFHFWGIDGCRGGWVACGISRHRHRKREKPQEILQCLSSDLSSLLASILGGGGRTILIDIPIGLPDRNNPQRQCDVEARRILGRGGASSVFSPPCREALYEASYAEACDVNGRVLGRRISIQTWNICPRIREADQWMRNRSRESCLTIHESHPEVCFTRLAGADRRLASKKSEAGHLHRLCVLRENGLDPDLIGFPQYSGDGQSMVHPAQDDILDALVLALTASFDDRLEYLPDGDSQSSLSGIHPVEDSHGLPMKIAMPPVGFRTREIKSPEPTNPH